MKMFITNSLKQLFLIAVIVSMPFKPALSGDILGSLKTIEKGIGSLQKKPKVQADVGGVKVDVTGCKVKTGVKTVDKSTKEKTESQCDPKKKGTKVTAKSVEQSNDADDR